MTQKSSLGGAAPMAAASSCSHASSGGCAPPPSREAEAFFAGASFGTLLKERGEIGARRVMIDGDDCARRRAVRPREAHGAPLGPVREGEEEGPLCLRLGEPLQDAPLLLGRRGRRRGGAAVRALLAPDDSVAHEAALRQHSEDSAH